MIEMDRSKSAKVPANVKVFGIGGCGGNVVDTMIRSGMEGVDFIVCNTDQQVLDNSLAPTQLPLGKGMGAGGKPEDGRRAAEESKDEIRKMLDGADMVYLTAGMGGGTGTGAIPIVAGVAYEMGLLTVAVVTRPFDYEGLIRKRQAEEGIQALGKNVDSLTVIPNEKLLALAGKTLSFKETFVKSDEVLLYAVQSVSDLITFRGYINLDFQDVRSIMKDTGAALMGTGVATGEGRAMDAVNMAISHPLMEDVQIDGAMGVLVNITGTSDMGMHEVAEAMDRIKSAASEEANIISGVVFDERMGDALRITVIATGFPPAVKATSSTSAERWDNAMRAQKHRPLASVPRIEGAIEPDSYGSRRIVRMGSVSDLELDGSGDACVDPPSPPSKSGTAPGGILKGGVDYEKPAYLRRSPD